MYVPKPENTEDIYLSPELARLAEKLAANAHDVWSKKRIEDGWIYGPKRDDENKMHPCLVPYEMLPEKEKDYDRKLCEENLKLILKYGFKIKKE